MSSGGAAAARAQVAQVKSAMAEVWRRAVLMTIQQAQNPIQSGGNMPVKSGFLRFSGQAAIGDATPPLVKNPGGLYYVWDAGKTYSVVASATLDDKITFAWGADYAVFQEYGSRGRDGRRFAGLAAQNWQANVAWVAAEVAGRKG